MSPDEQSRADEQAIEALAEALRSASYAFFAGDENGHGWDSDAREIWSRIDRQALRRALLAEPIEDLPDDMIVNGHSFIHVATCPCERMRAEVARLGLDQPPLLGGEE